MCSKPAFVTKFRILFHRRIDTPFAYDVKLRSLIHTGFEPKLGILFHLSDYLADVDLQE